MGDIPARRADGAGADFDCRRASIVGEAKRRLSADGRHPERNFRTRTSGQKLQDKKIQAFDVHYRLTAEPVVQRVSHFREDAPQYFMRIKVRTKREADNNVSFMKRKDMRSSGTFGLLLMVWTNGVDYAVRAGQTQTMCFGVSTAQLIVPPPFNKPNAPRRCLLIPSALSLYHLSSSLLFSHTTTPVWAA